MLYMQYIHSLTRLSYGQTHEQRRGFKSFSSHYAYTAAYFSIYKLHIWRHPQWGRTSAGASGIAESMWEINWNYIVHFVLRNAAKLFSLFLYMPTSHMQGYTQDNLPLACTFLLHADGWASTALAVQCSKQLPQCCTASRLYFLQ